MRKQCFALVHSYGSSFSLSLPLGLSFKFELSGANSLFSGTPILVSHREGWQSPIWSIAILAYRNPLTLLFIRCKRHPTHASSFSLFIGGRNLVTHKSQNR